MTPSRAVRALVPAFVLWSLVAHAGEGGDLQRFHPSAVPWTGLGAGAGETLEPGKWVAGLHVNYAYNPLVVWDDGARLYSTVRHNVTIHAVGAIGVVDWFTAEFALPFVPYQSGNDPTFPLAGQAIGDLRLTPRFRILTQWKHGAALSFAPTVIVPLGGASALAGDPSVSVVPEATLSMRAGGLSLASQLAIRLRRNLDVLDQTVLGPEALLRFAASARVSPQVDLIADLNGGLALATAAAGPVGNPLELLVGARYRPDPSWTVTFGAGPSIFSAPGTPDVRVLAGVAYGNIGEPPSTLSCRRKDDEGEGTTLLRALGTDTDQDGLDDACDRCVDVKETVNGYLDLDGCADDRDGDGVHDGEDKCIDKPGPAPGGCPDSDGDGFLDDVDACVDQPEDKDSFEDSDGCPERDNDHDGLDDVLDRCPMVPEDKDGFEDDDGCIDADNDKDAFPDADDKCPDAAEDKDGFEDTDGCPDPDNDLDGVLDAKDKCPNEKETINGFEDEDGCPDTKGKVLVVVRKERIEILDKVYFATNKDVIEKRSFGLLDQVALTIKAHPEITRIRVEGHTDDVGGREKNLDLSQRRAQSVVNYLVKAGLEKARLLAQGYAFDRPLLPNTNEKNRAENRRVEFIIVPDEPPAPPPDALPVPAPLEPAP